MSPFTSSGLTGSLFADAEMAEILSDRRWLEAMLDFEAALARAEAEVGVIPKEAADIIASCCVVDLYDIAEIGLRTTLAGNPAIPLVAMLTEKVREKDVAAAEFVHYGATSQDVIDSALGLLHSDASALIERRARASCDALLKLVQVHRRSIMVGRTLLQHALPVTFALKCAQWLEAMRLCANIVDTTPGLQFGGAAGTLASIGTKAAAVYERLQSSNFLTERKSRVWIGFGLNEWPFHSQRMSEQDFAAKLGTCTAAMGKIARDITLLMQTEVAEVFEPSAPGKGGSSTLPHKRNPVQSVAIIAIATRTPGLVATMLSAGMQEHERGVGGWHAEWDTMRELLLLTGAAALHMQTMLEGLEVDTDRMRANLELTNGLIMAERVTFALAPALGKSKAKTFMEAACKQAVAEKRHLWDVLKAMPETAALDLDALFDPATYLGTSDVFIDRILALYEDEKQYMSGARS